MKRGTSFMTSISGFRLPTMSILKNMTGVILTPKTMAPKSPTKKKSPLFRTFPFPKKKKKSLYFY
jgi:hypothetical protein